MPEPINLNRQFIKNKLFAEAAGTEAVEPQKRAALPQFCLKGPLYLTLKQWLYRNAVPTLAWPGEGGGGVWATSKGLPPMQGAEMKFFLNGNRQPGLWIRIRIHFPSRIRIKERKIWGKNWKKWKNERKLVEIVNKFLVRSMVFYFLVICVVFFNSRKFFIVKFVKFFVKLDPGPH